MKILVFCFLFVSSSVMALESSRILDIEFKVEPPTGYCIVGTDSASEKKLWEGINRGSGKIAIIQLSAPCDELEAYKNGTSHYLNHFAYLGALKNQGEIQKVSYSRAQFIEGSAKAQSLPKLDLAEATRVMKHALKDDHAQTTSGRSEMLGVDSRAVYLAVHGSFATSERKSWRMTSLGALTIVKSLVVGIYVADIAGKPRSPTSDAVLQNYLNNFLRDN